MRRRRTPNVADLDTLADRYGIDDKEFLAEQFRAAEEAERLSPPTTFQDVSFWFVAETDAWFIRWLREEHDVLQGDLAAELGVSQSLMSKWEIEGGCPALQITKMREHVQRIAERTAAEVAA